jgi:hypothetical protein
MTVWYTKDIYVSFVNCFVVIPPHHKNVLLLALTLVQHDCYYNGRKLMTNVGSGEPGKGDAYYFLSVGKLAVNDLN